MPRAKTGRAFVPQTPGGQIGAGMVTTLSELGNALRTYRVRVGLSQRLVAQALKCSQARLSSLERGETRNLTERDLRCLAVLFKISAHRLRRLIPPPAPLLPPLTPLARLLRARREALGLSRAELAARAGTNAMYLGTLERDARVIRYDTMFGLAKALGLDTRVLAPFVVSPAGKPGSALGLAIRQRRQDLCLSARMVGRLAGVSKTLVLAIEAGRVNLGRGRRSARTMQGLARALSLDPTALAALRPPLSGRASTPPATTVGGYVARQRMKRRWSQEDLARRVGLAAATICWIERNRTCPRVSTLDRLAKALDIDVGVLLKLTAAVRLERYRR